MKHPLLLLFALLASCAGEVSKDRLVERDGITYEVLSTEPYSGSVYTEYENLGRVKNGEYKDGLREGPWLSFFENGQLGDLSHYKNGLRNGLWESYYDNGQLEMRAILKDDIGVVSEHYQEDGKTLSDAESLVGKKNSIRSAADCPSGRWIKTTTQF